MFCLYLRKIEANEFAGIRIRTVRQRIPFTMIKIDVSEMNKIPERTLSISYNPEGPVRYSYLRLLPLGFGIYKCQIIDL